MLQCDIYARVGVCIFLAAGESREKGELLSVTFIEVCVILCVLGEGETVGDLQPVFDYQAQQDALNHLTALALFLVVLDNLHHHLWNRKSNIT